MEARELLGATEDKSISSKKGNWFALQTNQWFFTKRKQEKSWVSVQTWEVVPCLGPHLTWPGNVWASEPGPVGQRMEETLPHDRGGRIWRCLRPSPQPRSSRWRCSWCRSRCWPPSGRVRGGGPPLVRGRGPGLQTGRGPPAGRRRPGRPSQGARGSCNSTSLGTISGLHPELYIVHKVQIKISSLRWSEKKVQIKVHAWTWTWAVILSSHKLTVLNAHQWSDVSLRSKLKFKFRHELWSELFLKLTQRPDLICELKIRSDLLYNSALMARCNWNKLHPLLIFFSVQNIWKIDII